MTFEGTLCNVAQVMGPFRGSEQFWDASVVGKKLGVRLHLPVLRSLFPSTCIGMQRFGRKVQNSPIVYGSQNSIHVSFARNIPFVNDCNFFYLAQKRRIPYQKK